ncbi:unnamed protein product [Colias eurytheme]|nr:unnamed protein product [Colias eurytheme]
MELKTRKENWAYERRFPSCPQIPVVLECVITDDSWTADDSQRQTTRRCQLNVEAPYLLKKMIGVDYVYFIQKNQLDLQARVLEIEATNETFAARVSVVEKCRYYVHPENAQWTCFEQSALLDVKNFFGLESTVEKIAMKQYAANIAKGKELIEVFMREVHADGVRELPVWSAGAAARNRELRRAVSRGAEPLSPRRSVPGTSASSKRSNLALSKSSNRLLRMRSKSATNREHDKSSHSLWRRSKSKSKLDDQASTSHISIKDNRDDKKGYEAYEERVRNTALANEEFNNIPNTIRFSEDDLTKPVDKPCVCDNERAARESGTRWDNLLIVLVCAVIIVYVLSSPLSFLFRRDR